MILAVFVNKGHFPPGGIFSAERHFLLFKDWRRVGVKRQKKILSRAEIPPSGKQP